MAHFHSFDPVVYRAIVNGACKIGAGVLLAAVGLTVAFMVARHGLTLTW
jgi:hypothetical protein